MKKKMPVFVTSNKTFAIKMGKNISKKKALSCGEIIVAKYSEMERK